MPGLNILGNCFTDSVEPRHLVSQISVSFNYNNPFISPFPLVCSGSASATLSAGISCMDPTDYGPHVLRYPCTSCCPPCKGYLNLYCYFPAVTTCSGSSVDMVGQISLYGVDSDGSCLYAAQWGAGNMIFGIDQPLTLSGLFGTHTSSYSIGDPSNPVTASASMTIT